MRKFEIILFQTQSLSIKAVQFYKEHFKTFCDAFVVEVCITYNNIPSGVTTMGSDRENPGAPKPMVQMGAPKLRR